MAVARQRLAQQRRRRRTKARNSRACARSAYRFLVAVYGEAAAVAFAVCVTSTALVAGEGATSGGW
jgi:hypothetical protein